MNQMAPDVSMAGRFIGRLCSNPRSTTSLTLHLSLIYLGNHDFDFGSMSYQSIICAVTLIMLCQVTLTCQNSSKTPSS